MKRERRDEDAITRHQPVIDGYIGADGAACHAKLLSSAQHDEQHINVTGMARVEGVSQTVGSTVSRWYVGSACGFEAHTQCASRVRQTSRRGQLRWSSRRPHPARVDPKLT